jgi:hypothetical protein
MKNSKSSFRPRMLWKIRNCCSWAGAVPIKPLRPSSAYPRSRKGLDAKVPCGKDSQAASGIRVQGRPPCGNVLSARLHRGSIPDHNSIDREASTPSFPMAKPTSLGSGLPRDKLIPVFLSDDQQRDHGQELEECAASVSRANTSPSCVRRSRTC